MRVDKAIERLTFTISNQNKPNKTDAEALNSIIDFVSNALTDKAETNIPFAKILCLYLSKRYDDNNDMNTVLKTLGKDLSYPLNFHIETLSSKMISCNIINYVNSLTIDVTAEEMLSIEALNEKETEFFKVHGKSIIEAIKKENTKEQIKDNLYKTANEILRKEEYNV